MILDAFSMHYALSGNKKIRKDGLFPRHNVETLMSGDRFRRRLPGRSRRRTGSHRCIWVVVAGANRRLRYDCTLGDNACSSFFLWLGAPPISQLPYKKSGRIVLQRDYVIYGALSSSSTSLYPIQFLSVLRQTVPVSEKRLEGTCLLVSVSSREHPQLLRPRL